MAADARYNETTRYLCAATYLDAQFRETVLKEIDTGEHRAIGESYGVDRETVVWHALAARRRELGRDIVLAILLLVALLAFFNSAQVFLLALLAAWITVGVALWTVKFSVIAPYLQRGKFGVPAQATRPLPTGATPVPVGWPTPGGIPPQGAQAPYAPPPGQPPSYPPYPPQPTAYPVPAQQPAPVATRTQPQLQPQGATAPANVVVYSGYSPFIGAGFAIGGWSLALNVQKGREHLGQRLTPIPFRLTELYSEVTRRLGELRVNGMTVETKLHVNGTAIRDDRRFLADPLSRPYVTVAPTLLETYAEHPTDDVRHYVRVRVVAWQGELVFSLFLRFVKLGEKLFIETSYFVLPPVNERYRSIDELTTYPTFREMRAIVGTALRQTLPLLVAAPGRVVQAMLRPWSRSRQHRDILRSIRELPTFDYGAARSLREIAASSQYRQYFQKLDKDMYVKVIELHLLESLIAFLDEHNIDTTEFNEQRQTILNNGVIVSGGSLSAENLAVGEKSRAGLGGVLDRTRATVGATVGAPAGRSGTSA